MGLPVLVASAGSMLGVVLAWVVPPPEPAPTVSAPTTVELLAPAVETPVGPIRPSSSAVRKSMRRFRRSGGVVLGAGLVGLGAAVGIQIGRGVLLRQCADTGNPESDACLASTEVDAQIRGYATVGMAMMVAGSAGAGGLFGNAAATRDVHQRGRKPKVPTFAKFTGIMTMGVASAWVLGRNIHFWHQEIRCDGDVRCIASVRPQRWLYNDIGALTISLGAGMLGYSLAYTRQSKALMSLRVSPVLGRSHAGATASIAF